MAYHWMKHKKDFGKEITVEEYFKNKSDNLFNPKNETGSYYSQMGNIKHTYATKFGARLHVGFTFGDSQTKASHFVKDLK